HAHLVLHALVAGGVQARVGEELVDLALLHAVDDDGVNAAAGLFPDQAERGVKDGVGEAVAGARAGGDAAGVGDEVVGGDLGDDAVHGAAGGGGGLGVVGGGA